MPTATLTRVPRARITKGMYFVDNRTLRLYCVLGFRSNRTKMIFENCRTGKEFEIRVDCFNDRFSEGVKIVNARSSSS